MRTWHKQVHSTRPCQWPLILRSVQSTEVTPQHLPTSFLSQLLWTLHHAVMTVGIDTGVNDMHIDCISYIWLTIIHESEDTDLLACGIGLSSTFKCALAC